MRRPHLHVVQRLADIGVPEIGELHRGRLVGVDRHDRHPLAAVVLVELPDSRLVQLRGRAGVAGEDHRQDTAVRVVAQ